MSYLTSCFLTCLQMCVFIRIDTYLGIYMQFEKGTFLLGWQVSSPSSSDAREDENAVEEAI